MSRLGSRSFPLGSPKPKKRCGASQLLCTMPGCDTVHGLPLSLVPSDNSKNEERVNIETETPLCGMLRRKKNGTRVAQREPNCFAAINGKELCVLCYFFC